MRRTSLKYTICYSSNFEVSVLHVRLLTDWLFFLYICISLLLVVYFVCVRLPTRRINAFDSVSENMCRRSGLAVRNYYRSGSGPIWLDYVQCLGDELTIAECAHNGWGKLRSCSRSEDVSIICDNSKCWPSPTPALIDSVRCCLPVFPYCTCCRKGASS